MENWKDIPGFAGYQVSDLGRVRSFIVGGREDRGVEPRVLRPRPQPVSHLPFVRLYRGTAPAEASVARLVLIAFVSKPRRVLYPQYADGDRRNCRLDNLSWGTKRDTWAAKADRSRRSLTTAERREIGRALARGRPVCRIAATHRLSRTTIYNIKNAGRKHG